MVSFSLSGKDHPGVPSNSGASPGATSIGSVCGGALGRKRSHTQTRSREGRQPLPARTREVRMAHIGPGAQRADSVQRIGRQYRPNRLIALGHGRRIKACDKARESCAHRSGWRRSLAWHRSAPWRPLASCWRFSRVVASSRARLLANALRPLCQILHAEALVGFLTGGGRAATATGQQSTKTC